MLIPFNFSVSFLFQIFLLLLNHSTLFIRLNLPHFLNVGEHQSDYSARSYRLFNCRISQLLLTFNDTWYSGEITIKKVSEKYPKKKKKNDKHFILSFFSLLTDSSINWPMIHLMSYVIFHSCFYLLLSAFFVLFLHFSIWYSFLNWMITIKFKFRKFEKEGIIAFWG